MTQHYGPSLADILRATEVLNRQKVPTRSDKEIRAIRKANGIIETHMPLDEIIKEASDKDD